MSIKVSWLNEDESIIVYDMQGRWSWQELFEAIEQAADMMDRVEHRVDIILDMRQSPTMPTLSPHGMRGVADARTTNQPNMGKFYLVGASPLIRSLYDIFSRMYPAAGERYQLSKTMQEARAAIASSGTDYNSTEKHSGQI